MIVYLLINNLLVCFLSEPGDQQSPADEWPDWNFPTRDVVDDASLCSFSFHWRKPFSNRSWYIHSHFVDAGLQTKRDQGLYIFFLINNFAVHIARRPLLNRGRFEGPNGFFLSCYKFLPPNLYTSICRSNSVKLAKNSLAKLPIFTTKISDL